MAIQISGKVKGLDGFNVSRILPNEQKRRVGPFVFFTTWGLQTLNPAKE